MPFAGPAFPSPSIIGTSDEAKLQISKFLQLLKRAKPEEMKSPRNAAQSELYDVKAEQDALALAQAKFEAQARAQAMQEALQQAAINEAEMRRPSGFYTSEAIRMGTSISAAIANDMALEARKAAGHGGTLKILKALPQGETAQLGGGGGKESSGGRKGGGGREGGMGDIDRLLRYGAPDSWDAAAALKRAAASDAEQIDVEAKLNSPQFRRPVFGRR